VDNSLLLSIRIPEILILLIIALVSDIKTFKIKNHITLTFTAAGIVTNTINMGFEGLKASLLGWCTPVILLIILYFLKMLGAGDIKLFGAIGAIMGYKFAAYSVLFSFILGGIIGIGFLAVRRNALERIKYFFNYIKCCVLSCSLLEYSDFKSNATNDRFRFTYAIVPGTLLQMVLIWIAV
jgi:prepilin peptidase CpaA